MGSQENEAPPQTHDGALCGIDEFLKHTYSYLIVGGGTAGLVLANRLSEVTNVTVGVLEAGPAKLNDPMILMPGLATQGMYSPDTNWLMKSVPQVHGGNRTHDVSRGKVLGGSSAINYMMYNRGQRADYDDWATLLNNDDWGWEGLLPYMLKHEQFEGEKSKYAHKREYHGSGDGIHTSFPTYRCPIEDAWAEACQTVLDSAHKEPEDAWSGSHTGIYTCLATIDQTVIKATRSYSTSAYLQPILRRENLKVLTGAHVSRIIVNSHGGELRATGVEFTVEGQIHSVTAAQEIILSAGAIHTPQLLELSGIGDPTVLANVGIDCILPNLDVGANFQDHLLTGLNYTLAPGVFSLDSLHEPELQAKAVAEYTTSQSGPLSTGQSSMGFVAYRTIASGEEVEAAANMVETKNTASSKQAHLEAERLRSPQTAGIHVYGVAANFNFDHGHDCSRFFEPPPPGTNRFVMGVSLQYPSSRGHVHITSPDPLQQPEIDPAYLSHPADLAVLCAALRYADKCFQIPCLKECVAQRWLPQPEVDLDDQTQLEQYVRTHSNTEYHPIGTAAMGKVVDDRLCVKGIKGLRICDASVFPGNVSGNLVATVYAVAEKAADLIKQDSSKL